MCVRTRNECFRALQCNIYTAHAHDRDDVMHTSFAVPLCLTRTFTGNGAATEFMQACKSDAGVAKARLPTHTECSLSSSCSVMAQGHEPKRLARAAAGSSLTCCRTIYQRTVLLTGMPVPPAPCKGNRRFCNPGQHHRPCDTSGRRPWEIRRNHSL